MALDQCQGQLTDLGQESLETLVLGAPCLHLPEEVRGDVDGARLAVVFEGQVVGRVVGVVFGDAPQALQGFR
jgi:hypothetical protein